jgi:hypothetical protein
MEENNSVLVEMITGSQENFVIFSRRDQRRYFFRGPSRYSAIQKRCFCYAPFLLSWQIY